MITCFNCFVNGHFFILCTWCSVRSVNTSFDNSYYITRNFTLPGLPLDHDYFCMCNKMQHKFNKLLFRFLCRTMNLKCIHKDNCEVLKNLCEAKFRAPKHLISHYMRDVCEWLFNSTIWEKTKSSTIYNEKTSIYPSCGKVQLNYFLILHPLTISLASGNLYYSN